MCYTYGGMEGTATIIALFLLLQAAPPVPRKAADSGSKGGKAHQEKSAPDKPQSNSEVVGKPQPPRKARNPARSSQARMKINP